MRLTILLFLFAWMVVRVAIYLNSHMQFLSTEFRGEKNYKQRVIIDQATTGIDFPDPEVRCRKIQHPLYEKRCYVMWAVQLPSLHGELAFIARTKEIFRQRLAGYSLAHQGLLRAFVIGDLVFDEVYSQFLSLGLLHLLSVSGLHVHYMFFCISFLIGKLALAFRLTIYSDRVWSLVLRPLLLETLTLILLLYYVFVCDFMVPAQRAYLVIVLGFLNRQLEWGLSALQRFLCAFFIHVAYDPGALFMLGFGLSWSAYLLLLAQSNSGKESWRSVLKLQLLMFFVTLYWIRDLPLFSIAANLIFVPPSSALFTLALLAVVNPTRFLADYVFAPVFEFFLMFIEYAYEIGLMINQLMEPQYSHILGKMAEYQTIIFIVIILSSLHNLAKRKNAESTSGVRT